MREIKTKYSCIFIRYLFYISESPSIRLFRHSWCSAAYTCSRLTIYSNTTMSPASSVSSFSTSLAQNQAVVDTVFWLKIITCLLPIAWILGILPPIDGLVLFLLEQCYIFVYGGTATASNLRLFMQLFGSLLLSTVYFLPSDLITAIILAAFGYIFASVDLLYICGAFLRFLKQKTSSRSVTPSDENASNSNSNKISLTPPSVPEVRRLSFRFLFCTVALACLFLSSC